MEPIGSLMARLQFASDAEWLALTGLACWLGAAVCLVMDRRRGGERSIERLEKVGFMPWTSLFVALAIIGGGCLAISLPVVLGRL
ncbi:MAG: hypothetical protein WA985_00380 [Erythrobacter sp.]|uniref:hypothetical protein n=1 Tax=Erythrobacter sp. TaxID=1042 RepID=UPI003C75997C